MRDDYDRYEVHVLLEFLFSFLGYSVRSTGVWLFFHGR